MLNGFLPRNIGDDRPARRLQQLIQCLGPFPQRSINKQFSRGVEDIEYQIRDRRVAEHFVAHFLPAQSLLQNSKRPSVAHLGRVLLTCL